MQMEEDVLNQSLLEREPHNKSEGAKVSKEAYELELKNQDSNFTLGLQN